MKNKTLALASLAVATAASLISCDKQAANDFSSDESTSEKRVECTFSISRPGTKATSGMDDAEVNTIQIFVFKMGDNDIQGVIDAQSERSTDSQVPLECTLGTRAIVAVVNGPSSLSFSTIDELYSEISHLNENSAGSFVMVGRLDTEIDSDDTSITVEVKRLVAKVAISKITFNFKENYYTNLLNQGQIELQSIGLLNVANEVPYLSSGAYTPDYYYLGGYSAADVIDYLAHDEVSETASSSPYTTEHEFYCYPNSSNPKTALSIAVAISGKTCYYTKYIDLIESNKVYTVTNLTITRPGSDTEGGEILSDTFYFDVLVSEWESGDEYDEVI